MINQAISAKYGFVVNYLNNEKKHFFANSIWDLDGALRDACSYACLDPQTGKSHHFRWGYAHPDSTEPSWYWEMNLRMSEEEKALFA